MRRAAPRLLGDGTVRLVGPSAHPPAPPLRRQALPAAAVAGDGLSLSAGPSPRARAEVDTSSSLTPTPTLTFPSPFPLPHLSARLPHIQVICSLLRGIVSGMFFLHDVMGIVHGDLKPLNMLLRDGCVKLCDFGSSRLLQHDLSELAFSATLPYMAPELLRGMVGGVVGVGLRPGGSILDSTAVLGSTPSGGGALPGVGTGQSNGSLGSCGFEVGSRPGYAVDVFSFGVCLWEICVRLYPWHQLLERGEVDELRRRVSQGERPDPAHCPPALRAIVEACWVTEPSERPSFAEIAALDLESIGRGGPLALRTISRSRIGRSRLSSCDDLLSAAVPTPGHPQA